MIGWCTGLVDDGFKIQRLDPREYFLTVASSSTAPRRVDLVERLTAVGPVRSSVGHTGFLSIESPLMRSRNIGFRVAQGMSRWNKTPQRFLQPRSVRLPATVPTTGTSQSAHDPRSGGVVQQLIIADGKLLQYRF